MDQLEHIAWLLEPFWFVFLKRFLSVYHSIRAEAKERMIIRQCSVVV